MIRRTKKALERLRQHVPEQFMGRDSSSCSLKHVTKVKTLRAAARYIHHLSTIIANHDIQLQKQQQQQQQQRDNQRDMSQ